MATSLSFAPARRLDAKLRMAVSGVSGGGKTYTSLLVARTLAGPDGRIALIDTEHGSASKYAPGVNDEGLTPFDTLELHSFSPETYVEAIAAAASAGYDVLIIDSLSHAWDGKNGALELVDRKSRHTNNSFTAWGDVTPLHRRLIEAILSYPGHVLVTMRSKTEYAMEKDDRGKTTVKKLGMEPVQRKGIEYEFDVVGEMSSDNVLVISKSRCSALRGGVFAEPGADVGTVLKEWLTGDPNAVVADIADLRERFKAHYGDDADQREKDISASVSGGTLTSFDQLDGRSLVRVLRGFEAAVQKAATSTPNTDA